MIRKHPSADKLHKLLRQAYRERVGGAHTPADSQELMRRIRQLEAVLALVAVNLDFAPDAAWSLFTYESEAADLVQTLLL